MKILIYDCEIINCIPNRKQPNAPNLSYCAGWTDFENMGISVIGTWRNTWPWGKYEAFTEDEFPRLQAIANHADLIVGFNSVSFDDNLCKANGLDITTNFDLLCEIREAVGMPRHYVAGVTKGGYSLQSLAQANLNQGKTGTGELAPVLWQQGKKQEVINYCLQDVKLLKQLYFRFLKGKLIDPTNGEPINPKLVYKSK